MLASEMLPRQGLPNRIFDFTPGCTNILWTGNSAMRHRCALKWAQMEARSYKLLAMSPEENPG
jgi:hypothetical protein